MIYVCPDTRPGEKQLQADAATWAAVRAWCRSGGVARPLRLEIEAALAQAEGPATAQRVTVSLATAAVLLAARW